MLHRIACTALLSAGAAALGCRAVAPAAPFAPPARALELRLFEGAVLRGPVPVPVDLGPELDPAAAPRATCRVVFVEALDPTGGEPITSSAELVAATLGGEPIQVATELAERALWFDAGAAAGLVAGWNTGASGRIAQVGARSTVLPIGTTAEFSAEEPRAVDAPGFGEVRPGTAVLVSHAAIAGAPALSLALRVEDFVDAGGGDAAPGDAGDDGGDPNDDGAAAAPLALPRVLRRDLLVLGPRPEPGRGSVAIAAPVAVPGAPGAALVFVVELAAGSADPAHAAGVARALAEARGAAFSAEQRATALADDALSLSEHRRALRSLADPATRRSTLVYLAGATGAPLAQDLALMADESTLADCCAFISEKIGEPDQVRGKPAELAWRLEHAAWQFAAKRLAEDRLDVAVEGLLLRHAGEAGHFPSSIEDALGASADLPALARKFEEENRIFLEDSNPAARVRAFDWLQLRGLAPAGYDPLASGAARRAALRRAEEAAAATAGAKP